MPMRMPEFHGATVRISGVGRGKNTPQDMVTVTMIVRSEKLGRFEIDVHVTDQGNPNANVEEARGALQRFSWKLQEALKQPLSFEPH